jgi:glycerol-3-phosphate dehydrogenase
VRAAVKNVIAIAGIGDGLLRREAPGRASHLAEITRLGPRLGGRFGDS